MRCYQKIYAKNEVTYDVPRYYNVFECERKLLDRFDVSYERSCMATAREEYYMNMLYSLLNQNDRHGTPLWSKKLQEAVSRVMAETNEEEKDAKRNVNNVTMDHLFQSTPIISTQKE